MSARFTRIGLVGRFEDAHVADSMGSFARALLARGLEVVVHERPGPGPLPEGVQRVPVEAMAERIDLLVAIGGDGTMLYAAQLVLGRGIPLLGINRGRLGFLADVSPAEMVTSFDAVLAGQYEEDVRALLAATLTGADGTPRTCHALNDIVIQRYETGRMIELATWIGGAFVNSHGGDGLVIATPTGSTAYALSCGGPIMHPHLDAVVIAPISPHTLSDRPIVVRRDSPIEVRLAGRATSRAQVTFDGTLLGDLEPDSRLVVGPARETVTLLHPHGHDYYRILRSKLHWGRSARDADPPA